MLKYLLLIPIFFSSMVTASDVYQISENIVNSFEQKFGITKGKRRNHTKGFCFEGRLIPTDSSIQAYSSSPIFEAPSKVTGRLSHKGGNNHAPDNQPGEYGIGLKITAHSGEIHMMALNTLDFFPVATPKAFAELMRNKVEGENAVKAFKEKNPDLQRFKSHMAAKKKTLTPYEGSTYNSIHSFYLVNKKGGKHAVRWSFVPSKPQKIVLEKKGNFFLQNMQSNLEKHGVSWDMVITLANDADKINNAAIKWSGQHNKIIAAKLEVTSISSEENGKCDSINFDPLILSNGFLPSSDPLLEARRASYAISFGRRISEKK